MHAQKKKNRSNRVFVASSFKSTKEWIYFCLEFDLEVCCGCQSKARKRPHSDQEYSPQWHCEACPPRIHPDLWTVIQQRENSKTRCDLCGQIVEVRSCWISEDCQRLYCASHLKPVHVEDRYKMARQFLQRWFGPRYRLRKEGVERMSRVARQLDTASYNECTPPKESPDKRQSSVKLKARTNQP